jgi:DNA end-binding protein Ku
MPARAMWKGILSFGDVSIPVKLYSAVQDRGVHFRLLHERDKAPVQQQLVNPNTDKPIDEAKPRKGAPVGSGRFVLIGDDDLAAIEPRESRAIKIEHFVPVSSFDHALYERPYWVGPETAGDADYWALIDTLEHEKREGSARWVMRKRSYVGALRPEGGYLMLVTLRHVGELVRPEEIEIAGGRSPDAKEIRMADQLLTALQGPFDASEYTDAYRERVLELVARKAKGEKVELHVPRRKRATTDLAQALQRSIAAVGTAPKPAAQKEKRHGRATAA